MRSSEDTTWIDSKDRPNPDRLSAVWAGAGLPEKKMLYLTFLNSLCALTTAEEFAELISRLRDHGGKRPYISRTPAALFPGNPGLVDERYYSRLKTSAGQWYVDTNLNGATMQKVLNRACRVLGLVRGADFDLWGL